MEELTEEEIRTIQLLKNKNRMEQDQILAEIERNNDNVYDKWGKISWSNQRIRRNNKL